MAPTVRYENIFDSMSCGLIASDADGKIEYINHKALNILDLNQAGASDFDIQHLGPEVGSLFKDCLQSGNVRLGYYAVRNHQRLVIDSAPIRVGSKILGIIATLHNLEDFNNVLRYSDGYLKLSRQLDAIFKGSSDGLWVHDSKGTIININTVSEVINGIRAKDVIGKSIYELIDAGIFEGVVTPEILRTKRQFSTLSYIKKTQKRVLVTGTPILDEDGNVSLIVSNERDLTHWNAVKEDLERSRKVAEKYKDKFEELSLLESGQPEIVAESKEMNIVS